MVQQPGGSGPDQLFRRGAEFHLIMGIVSAILVPFALLLPASGDSQAAPVEQRDKVEAGSIPPENVSGEAQSAASTPERVRWPTFLPWPRTFVSQSFQPRPAWQVRIEQRITIRVAPRARAQPDMFDALPTRAIGPRFSEKRMGKCLPVQRISGVQPNGGSNLILYLSDKRMISAELERACRARDFYSGFYLAGSEDGNLCVDRDALQSRAGANCKLTRIRQLIELDE